MEREQDQGHPYHKDNDSNNNNNNDELDNGWTTIVRKNKKKNTHVPTNSYYFTDLPSVWNDTMIWKAFAKYGRISDVYVAKKKSVIRKTFGFDRFYNITNPKSFENTLKSTFIGTHRLKIHLARYQSKNNQQFAAPPAKITTNWQKPTPHPVTKLINQTSHHVSSHPFNTFGSQSYAESLTNKAKPKHPPTSLMIHSCPDLTKLLRQSLIGELQTLDTLPNLKYILDGIGLPNTRIKYIGGFHVLLELENDSQTEVTLNNTQLLDCFKSLKHWDEIFVLNNRLTWLFIEGLPPNAWHEAAFTRITGVNMPILVDETHVCIRIRKMAGECDEICKPETLDESQADSDSVTTHGSGDNENTSNRDKDNINGVNHGDNENVDDFLDDGFEDGSNCSNMFLLTRRMFIKMEADGFVNSQNHHIALMMTINSGV
nr:RNA-directed DNA polymerase, eukaryota [Tanacetum cinerariifolium]